MAQVSVVVPVYNIEQHLRQCLDSLAVQTLDDVEIICVDDGSTDSSPQILEEYAARDGRFRIITQANSGPGAARNAGLEQAEGKFLIFLDSDDWFEPDFLELMARKAEQTGADAAICRAVEFDTDGDRELPSGWMLKVQRLPGETFRPEDISEQIFQFTYGWPWDKLYRTSLIRQTRLRFPALRNSEDLAFVFPSLLAARHITVLDQTLIHHRVNRAASVSNTRGCYPDAPYEAVSIVKAFLAEHGLAEQYQQSCLNWAVDFLIWHVGAINDKAVRRRYLKKLKEEWFPSLLCGPQPPAFHAGKRTRCKYLLAKYAPGPVFCGVVDGYHSFKKLHGRKQMRGCVR